MMLSYIRRHLGLKLFLSYLVIIMVGVIVLVSTAEYAVPGAFDRHLSEMSAMMMGMMGRQTAQLEMDLYNSFRSAVTEAVALASLAAAGVAVIVSYIISRQVVAPVREMMRASQRIAEGHYQERVRVSGDIARNELDELAQLAMRFNQMADSLQQTEEMRRQLIADVAHELRTPLTAIKGSMEGLIDGVLASNEETYAQIYTEADRLTRLVSDLQELSRVQAGAFALELEPLPAPELIMTAVERLKYQYEEKGVTLRTDIPPDLPPVLVDGDRTEQVLLNLLGNALQFTPAGGDVLIAASLEPASIRISTRDTGIGISPEHLPHLFTRFYRVDKSRSRAGGGSGIGLTIAKYLVEAQGGTIWAQSPGMGKGSTFTVLLPTIK